MCDFFIIFFKPETELVVAWLRWSLHPLLVYMVYRPRDLYKSDSSPCAQFIAKLVITPTYDWTDDGGLARLY
jgi:hypothetical protein